MIVEPMLHPYPATAFPKLLGDVVDEVTRRTGIAYATCASLVLAAVDISATYAGVRVKLPNGDDRPVGLNFVNIGDTGEGWSTVARKILQPVYAHNAMLQEHYDAALQAYQSTLDGWNVEISALRAQIKKACISGIDASQIKEDLAAHWKSMPVKPRNACFIFENTTQRPLVLAMEGTNRFAAVITGEGDVILNGKSKIDHWTFNNLSDGSPHIRFDRGDAAAIVKNPRFAFCISVHPNELSRFIERDDYAACASGFRARCLYTYGPPTQGFRTVDTDDQEWCCLSTFKTCLAARIHDAWMQGETSGYINATLSLAPEAIAEWQRMARAIQVQMQPSGPLFELRDFAARVLETVARLAAAMHYFLGLAGDVISWETFARAAVLVNWYLYGFALLFGNYGSVPKWARDAEWLYRYLREKAVDFGTLDLERRLVRKCSKFREPGEFDVVLGTLVHLGLIFPHFEQGKAFIQVIVPDTPVPWPRYAPVVAPSLQPPMIAIGPPVNPASLDTDPHIARCMALV